MSPTQYAADELVRRRRHYQTLVNGKGYSAENIACEGAAFGEEALAAEALRTIHPARFTKRDFPDGQAPHAGGVGDSEAVQMPNYSTGKSAF